MSAANAYVDLLRAFQEAYAIHGRDYLWLEAVSREDIPGSLLPENYVGFIQAPGSHWNILGHICHASQFGAREVYCKLRAPVLATFCELATRAGAALPLSIRRSIPGYPDTTPVDPLNWWLRILWHLFPPSDEDLNPKEGATRIAFDDPFQDSIDAIDICKLNTDQPQLVGQEKWPSIVGAADREGNALRIEKAYSPAEKKSNSVHPDGMEGGRWLWWNNKRHDVAQGTVYRLLNYMWNRDFALYDHLLDAEVLESDVVPQTIRSYVHKANSALPNGFPWRLSTYSTNRHLTKISQDSSLRDPPRIPN
jgi:hypothetical protein